ncbi:orotate phosphoribosyltransferase-like protein [Methanosphaera sp. WGK6]|uniref:orotate phosphoribosyltransferase-like protein n=1 Tax=Methanosphaera sp. WGK6 TaxID=1561964 RepID=UPI00084C6EB3|nr:orotate phosphoribosyltransferase-like protein [Methanosphaera sp. WGK6]OED30607.1 orotate phosphoribosyltransferase [Methanosphaera sp. WGK6]
MNSKLIEKATELRNKGLTTGEIADELNISKDTTQWLIMQMTTVNKTKQKPDDFAINWRTIGSSSARMQHISGALADLALEEETVDVVVGISVSGVPFATMMANLLDAELSVFHPIKHMKNESAQGALSNNFANIKNKTVVIVDDVITSGTTVTDAITVCKAHGAKPIAVTVLVDKKGINDLNNVPVKSLIKINKVG